MFRWSSPACSVWVYPNSHRLSAWCAQNIRGILLVKELILLDPAQQVKS